MNCPFCQCEKSRVRKTIHRPGKTTRYRRCCRCGRNFPTIEYANLRIDRRSRATVLASIHITP